MGTKQNNKIIYRGSEWRKWDLHVHSPATYGGSYDEFVKNLSTSEVEVIGINDYCTIEGYEQVISKSGKTGDKVLFPVIEFRMNNIVLDKDDPRLKSGPCINFHIILDNDIDIISRIKTWLNSLDCIYEGGKQEKLGNIKKTENYLKLTFDYFKVVESLEKDDGLKDNFLVWLPYDEYGGIDNIDPENDGYFKLGLINKANIIGSSNKKQIDFFLWKSNKYPEGKIKEWLYGRQIPCIKGSDAHEINYPFGKLKDKDSQPMDKYCWIKADATFEGLKQILYEPRDRVYIGSDEPSAFKHAVIESFNVSAESDNFFLKQIGNTPLNASLNCVIGPRGSGKSTLLDATAFSLGDQAVLDEERNNYIGSFFAGNREVDLISSKVKYSSSGEIKDLTPKDAKSSGFLFDYYYQKQIGYLADPNNEEDLSRFLFEKIFRGDASADPLFTELNEQRESYISQLAINREKIIACEKEIIKEGEINAKITDKKNRAQFLSQASIKGLLEERNKVIKLNERVDKIKSRIKNLAAEPLISTDQLVDVEFFGEMKLSSIDPKGTIIPASWKKLESTVDEFLKSLGDNKESLEDKIKEITAEVSKIEPSLNLEPKLNEIWNSIQAESTKQGFTITPDELGKLDAIQKEILTLEEQLAAIQNHKKSKQSLLEERKRLLGDYGRYLGSIKNKLESHFDALLVGDGAILNDTIKLEIHIVSLFDDYPEIIKSKAIHGMEEEQIPKFPNKKPLLELFRSLDTERIINDLRNSTFGNWNVNGLGRAALEYFDKVKNKEEVAMHLEELLPELTSHLLWRPDATRDFKLLKNCSIGERGTALLSVILVASREPLIIDQLEDDLDHFYLYKTLTPIIKEVKKRRQLLFATHDANIVVNGDAELILIITTEDGKFGEVTPTSIENLENRKKVMDMLEGGKDAFRQRKEKYGFK